MKRIFAILSILSVVFTLNAAFAQGMDKPMKGKAKAEKGGKEMTVTGEVVDVSCYLAHGTKGAGEDHKACAEACAKAGGPLGILTKDGMLYVSVMPDDHSAGPNAMLTDHITHQVEATGVVRKKGGVNGIMITKVAMAGEMEPKKSQ
jgi:hypothetical protein